MVETDRLTPITQYVKDLLIANAGSLTPVVDPKNIWWPDQVLIPQTPALCVDSGPLVRTLTGIGGKGRTDNDSTVYVMCYLCRLTELNTVEVTVEQLAESVMDVLHADVTFGGLVIHGFVTGIEPGYSHRNNSYYRTARVTWEGKTKTLIA